MKFLLLSFIISSFAMAGFPIVKVVQISGEYKDKKGTAYAENASYDLEDVKISHRDIEVKFNKILKNLVLHDDNTTVELKFDFDFLNVFNSVSFNGVDIFSGGNQLDMNLDDLNIFIEEDAYHLNRIVLSSDITQYNTDGRDISILNGILLNGELKVNYIDFGKVPTKTLKNDLDALSLSELKNDELNKAISIPVIARYLSLKIYKGEFTGAVLLDSWLNAWLRLNGSIENLEEKNQMIITLNKAKLGIFSIKSLLLRKVRELEVDTIKVDGDRIIVNLEGVFSNRGGRSSLQ